MTPSDIKLIVKEEVAKQRLNETLVSLDHLHDGVSTSSETGRSWFKLISSLESVINDVNDFNGQYSSGHGPLPNTKGALIQLQMVSKILVGVKPVIMGMDDIESKDQ